VFTNTKQDAVRVAARLAGNGYECSYIIGDLPQSKRSKIIENIKSGKLKYLVATDVAARGLHINDLDLVINYDIPEDFENYVHRIGRTARAGKTGMAVTFACEKFVYGLEAIESYIKMKIPVEWAGDELFAEDMSKDEFIRNYMRESKQTRIVSEYDDKKTDKSGKDKKGKERSSSGARPEKKEFRKGPEKRDSKDNNKDNNKDNKNRKQNADTKPKISPDKKSHDRSGIDKNNRRKDPDSDKVIDKVSKDLTPDKRMDYYKQKYGEDFTVKREITADPSKKSKKPVSKPVAKTPEKSGSLLSKIKSIFRKK
jgi:ATP-dependent RNA helicase RhlB